MSQTAPPQPRSSTGHVLLPAYNSNDDPVLVPLVTSRHLVTWTFGRGTVIWRIWPAVLLHTVFAAVVVTVSLETDIRLGIPNIMLTVLGVVIGFVISYRASSGYDRYWQGRSAWSDMARSSRTFSRLVWIHIPLKLSSTSEGSESGSVAGLDVAVARRVMAEKRTALGLIEGFVVSVKHHLRGTFPPNSPQSVAPMKSGEMGIYYEDLYPLVKPLHNHPQHHHHDRPKQPQPGTTTIAAAAAISIASPQALHPPQTLTPAPAPELEPTALAPANPSTTSAGTGASLSTPAPSDSNPIIPPINAYGTFAPPLPLPLALARTHTSSSHSSSSSSTEHDDITTPLLPSANRSSSGGGRGLFGSVAGDLVPFAAVWRAVGYALGWRRRAVSSVVSQARAWDVETCAVEGGEGGDGPPENGHTSTPRDPENGYMPTPAPAPARASTTETSARLGFTHAKHRPRLAGGGENLPLEILRALSVWVSVLDERGVVPGSALGGMYASLAAFEDSLCTLERILTTPLPFVYSVHIRHTVWIYLFFLPFQLVDLFAWYAIPGVGIAAFIYLGLIAAGEEIEQPFGYDENDLDLDFFCRAIVHADIERLKRVVCPHVYLGARTPRHAHDVAVDPRTKLDAVFGGGRHE
ncbi:Bestrophin, RFP-TM, chloride channel-domain-containing protein [Trametes meyenii]|nr:Bestrophin, RFP-TM, chloride channel-domain-containing protein [Trametes meyenii]